VLRDFKGKTAMLGRGARKHRPGTAGANRRCRAGRRFETLEPRVMLDGGSLLITEFLADNNTVLADADGDFPDWIEIHNPTQNSIELDGWYLTDDSDKLKKWEFPEIPLEAGGYLVVFASEKDRTDPAELHTSFQLDNDGEYLALVRPDGSTVAHKFTSAAQQATDVSYGLAQAVTSLVSEGSQLSYLVPAATDATLGSDWTAAEFDDSVWAGGRYEPSVLITEAGTVADFAEIQNVSNDPIDTSGWVVAVNNAVGREPDINKMHETLWHLPDLMAPGEVLYRHDDPDEDPYDPTYHDNYWGEVITWKTNGPGWVVIVDDAGSVVDLVVWGYSEEEIATFAVNVNGFDITAADAWAGESITAAGARDHSLQRHGNADHSVKDNWSYVEGISMGVQNEELTIPFVPGGGPAMRSGVGFELNPPGIGSAIETDVAAKMHGENATLWTRFSFNVNDPSALGALHLRMKYNDGFVAYLNGREIAGQNAPDPLLWDSAATGTRSVEDSLVYEEINVSRFLGDLKVGKNVLAIHALNADAADDNLLVLPELIGTRVENAQRYFPEPTPGGPNVGGLIDFVDDTRFSLDRGFYYNPIAVSIITGTPGATIRYTTDGSQPTETNGRQYDQPIIISTTTTLRAAAFKADYLPSNVDTQTYLFIADVLAQSPAAAEAALWPPVFVNMQMFDYGMDPDIVGDGTWGPQLATALRSIPTISLVTDLDNLVDPDAGIYVNATQEGRQWERPTSVELINPDGTKGFQIDAGLRIRGDESRVGINPKHAFRLFFRKDYGDAALEYPLFGIDGADSFEKLDLRTSQDYSWAFQGDARNAMVRDVFSRDTQGAMGQPYTRSSYFHLYLNGQYWGLYQSQERSEAAYGESYLGGDRDDYDVIKVDPAADYTIQATDGNLDAWQDLWSQARAGFGTDEAYYRAQGLNSDGTRNPDYPVLLDVDNLIDYMLVILYTGDKDSPISELLGDDSPRNWYGVRNRNGESGFQFFVHEAEHTLDVGAENRNGPFSAGDTFEKSNPQWLHQQLMAHGEYRLQFADHAHKHLTNDGLLTRDAATARLQARADEIQTAIVAESARWGDAMRPADPFDKTDWLTAIGGIVDDFIYDRAETVLDQLRAATLRDGTPAPLYPDVPAPWYNQHGGDVAEGFLLWINRSSGTVFYTLDGSDPRTHSSQGGSAEVFTNTPIPITQSTLVKARVFSDGEWSALNEAQFYVGEPAAAGNLAITELNYNPYGPSTEELLIDPSFNNDDFEFIELRNIGDEIIDLTGVKFTNGIELDFSGSDVTELDPNEFVVIVRDSAAFQTRYGTGVNVAGQYTGSLNNGGERVMFSDRFGQVIVDFSYNDSGPWPGRADGNGSSLEVVSTAGDYSDEANWRNSSKFAGTPGSDSIVRPTNVVVNEVLSQPLPGRQDAIELYNTTGGTISVGGWYLSDSSGNYGKFEIPAGTSIEAGRFLVFTEDDFNSSGSPNDFGLSGGGDDVWLLETDAEDGWWFADHVEFGDGLDGVTFGRYPDGTEEFILLSQETLGGPNSEPRIGSIVINEMHVDPDVKTQPVEYVELYNAGTTSANLSGWYFSDGISYVFPQGTYLPAGGYLVVAENPPAVAGKYGIPTPLGPFVGTLSNEGENLVLRDAADIKQDEVDYGAGFPWPTVGDPPGYSMELINSELDNDLGGSWRSSMGSTPGRRNSVYAFNAAPQMRQVDHSPRQPAPGEEVAVSMKITDPDGVGWVTLSYQIVEPGSYIGIDDYRYENPSYWTSKPMYDDGIGGDATAGDDVYTTVLPGSVQQNRRMIRYRVTANDVRGASVTVPYADDPQPNFAYYVYDAVPSWTGSDRPGLPEVTYDSELLTSLPVYTLITERVDHLTAMTVPYRSGQADQMLPISSADYYRGSDYKWQGALVYNGEVYDHIRYRARGGVWRYAMGKNMWKFDFNRGHFFQAHDDYGNPYATKWDKLNFSALIQQGNFGQRGEQGLFEWAGFKLHDLAGNEASKCNFLHFRIVEDTDEGGPDQYSTDFRGLYMTIEQPDGRLLDEHGLPDGNFYKMEGGSGTLNNQGPTQPSDRSDLNAFMNMYKSGNPDAQWWRDNFDLQRYYSFRAIAMAIHDYDIHAGKNYFYYHNPETGKWSIHNWDLDLCWTTTYGGGGGNEPFRDTVLQRFPEFRIEYNNRMREIIDLLFNSEQTGMMLDECAQFIYTPGELSFADADAAMWDYNPILTSGYINSSKASHGRYYQAASPRDFGGMVQLEKNYVAARISGDTTDPTIASDSYQAPNKPTITYIGQDDYPVDGLTFRSSSFSSPVGASFAAMKWRIAEVTDPESPDFDPVQPRAYEITANWESDDIPIFDNTMTMPGGGVEIGKTYRARVRMKDSNGRWGHWSEPVQFVAGDPVGPVADGLRITEINYAPYAPTAAELAVNHNFQSEDFEFIELHNVAGHTLSLEGVVFTDGIEFDFAVNGVTELRAGEFLVIAKDVTAFAARYGTGVNAAGPYDLRLSNQGEQLVLTDAFGRTIHDFEYGVSGSWPGRANGKGSSLEIIDTAGDYGDSENWRSSREYGGSPGAQPGPEVGIVVNEVLSHTDPPLSDSIELYNTTDDPIGIGGWYLSDSNQPYKKYRIPFGTVIGGGEYLVFDERHFNPTPNTPGPNDFSLNGAHGDDVWLLQADGTGKLLRFVDHVEFPAAIAGESFGRWPNATGELYPMAELTLGPNDWVNSGPRVGPVIISEVHYNPGSFAGADGLEFIEICNPDGPTVDLTDWRIRKDVDYDFPDHTMLLPGGAIVIVSFDVNDDAKLRAFRDHYGIGESVTILGGYSSQLGNGGGKVQLQRPDEPPAEQPYFIPRLLEDEVIYADDGDWPIAADGYGQSLNRLWKDDWGNDPQSWIASPPTPGRTWFSATAAVAGRHVFYHGSSFGQAMAADKQALLPGQTATFANYTSYPAGINGIAVDVAGLPDGVVPAADDFRFHAGNDNDPDNWADAAPPTTITVQSGTGDDGSDRVLLVWSEDAVVGQWMQVTVLATVDTGLGQDDVFYFGNAPGESGNSAADAKVNATDLLATRNNPRGSLNSAPIDFRYDFNRDKRVNATDMLIARSNQTHLLDALELIAVPELDGKAEMKIDDTPESLFFYEFARDSSARKDKVGEEAVDEWYDLELENE